MREAALIDFQLGIDFDRTREFYDFAAALSMEVCTCRSLFVQFKQYVARYHPRGDLGVINFQHLAAELRWMQEWGDIRILLQALYEAGYVKVNGKRKTENGKRKTENGKANNGVNWDSAEVQWTDWLREQQQVGYRAKNRLLAAINGGYAYDEEDVILVEASGLMTDHLREKLKKGGGEDVPAKPKRKAAPKTEEKAPTPAGLSVELEFTEEEIRSAKRPKLKHLADITDQQIQAWCKRFREKPQTIWLQIVDLDKKMTAGELEAPRRNFFKAVEGLLDKRYGN